MYYTFKVCFHAKTKSELRNLMPTHADTSTKTDPDPGKPKSLIALMAAVTVSAGLAIDLCLPAMPKIAETLLSDAGRVQQTLSVFIFGVGFGQLLYGPLSDRYGRKPILLIGLFLYCVGGLLCALAQSVDQLIAFRLFQAFGAAVGAVVMRAVVRDLYTGVYAAKAFSQIMLVMMVAPLIAPLISAQLLLWFSWRIVFLILGLYGLWLVAIVALRLPETLSVNKRSTDLFGNLPRQYREVLTHRQALGYFLCGTFTFAGMFAFVTAAPFVYIEYFGVRSEYFGLLYGSNVLMLSLLSWINSRVIVHVGIDAMLVRATWLALAAAFALLFFTSTGIGGLWGVFPGLVVFIGTLGLIGANCNAGMLSPFEGAGGTASAIMGAGRFLLGGLASMLVGILHDGTPLPMAGVIFGCSLFALLSHQALVMRQPQAVT
jgi:DHA1 family bicyclomycin/chloramphenicol resistance-like MFS transporter